MSGRPLTTEERSYVSSVFGSTVDLEKVRVHQNNVMAAGPGIGGRTVGNDVYLASQSYNSGRDTLSSTGHSVLVHELTHVWQYQHEGLSYIPKSIVSSNDFHQALADGKTWDQLGHEQRAYLVQEWAMWSHQANDSKLDPSMREIAGGQLQRLAPYMVHVSPEAVFQAGKLMPQPYTPKEPVSVQNPTGGTTTLYPKDFVMVSNGDHLVYSKMRDGTVLLKDRDGNVTTWKNDGTVVIDRRDGTQQVIDLHRVVNDPSKPPGDAQARINSGTGERWTPTDSGSGDRQMPAQPQDHPNTVASDPGSTAVPAGHDHSEDHSGRQDLGSGDHERHVDVLGRNGNDYEQRPTESDQRTGMDRAAREPGGSDPNSTPKHDTIRSNETTNLNRPG